ncbi:MAG TPA: hypothetical protein VMH87_00445 [Pseudomonadales bacterium]|nr:hypothetical protein [Pseudomonadales bacterium]
MMNSQPKFFWTLAVMALVSASTASAQDHYGRSNIHVGQPPELRDPTIPTDSLAGALDSIHNPGHMPRVVRVELADKSDTNAPAQRIVKLAEFSNATFADAARALSEATGLNIAPSAAAALTRVQIYLTDLPAQDVLENLCTANGLWFRHDARTGVLRVFTVPEFRQDLSSFQEEQTEVFTLLYPNAYDIAYALQNLYGDRMVVDFRDDDNELMDNLQQRFDRFDIVNERSQGFGFNNNNSSGETGSGGYGQGSYGGQTYGPVSPPTKNPAAPLNADQIQTLQSDAESGNVNGQAPSDATAKIMDKRVNIYVSVVRRQNRIVVRTADQQTLDEISQTIAKLDVPTSQVLLDMKVLSIQLGDSFNSSFDYVFSSGEFSGSLSDGTIAHPSGPGQVPGGTGLQPNNLIFQYLGNNFAARLQLLENQNRVTELATPMLLTANNEVSQVFVGEQVPINTSFSGGQTVATVSGAVTTPATTSIQFAPIGTTLLVTPSINADRTVTLRLVQQNSLVNYQGATVLIPTGTGFENQAVDVVAQRSVSGTFVAKDGIPVMVGGLISEDVHANNSGVPYLSKIPLLGQLFRRDDKGRSRSELVVIIKPYIINTPAEAEGISRELLKNNSIHPNAASMSGTLNTYSTNQVPTTSDSYPLASPK